MKALGIHVFGGGFTGGVKEYFDVDTHLETHGFGLDSAREVFGVTNIFNGPAVEWPRINDMDFVFGNPRCTGFSTMTAGYGEETHGAWSSQTCDVHEFAEYVCGGNYPVVAWESVQQAYSTGDDLIKYLVKDCFAPKGYRIAHLFLNAATFGNTQKRKRYFFVAYKNDLKFNIEVPPINDHHPILYDAIWKLRARPTREAQMLFSKHDYDYDFDSYVKLTPDEKKTLPVLWNGWCLNKLGHYQHKVLPETYKINWLTRSSDMPFSMHCIRRLNYFTCTPTLHSSAARFIHPEFHRPLTVGEIATIMGWPEAPRGANPIGQIAKGVVPIVGEWLARQVALCLNGSWGTEDRESSYSKRDGWYGEDDASNKLEKVFNINEYYCEEKPDDCDLPYGFQHHRWNVEGVPSIIT